MMTVLRGSLGSLRGTGKIMKVEQWEGLEEEVGFLAPILPGIKPAASTVETTCSWSVERGGEQQRAAGDQVEAEGVVGEEREEREGGDPVLTGPRLLSRHLLLDDTGQWTSSTYRMRRGVSASQRIREEGTLLVPPVTPLDTTHTPIPPNGLA